MKKSLLIMGLLPLLMACGQNAASSSVDTSGVTSTTSEKGWVAHIQDMIGRDVEIKAGSYKRVVCVGAGALRLYSYIGDVNLLVGVEDIDNESLSSRPKMFDSSARPYFLANREHFATLPSCGVGGPNAQEPEHEKILSCNPDIIISEYETVETADGMQEKIGVPVITLSIGKSGVFDEKTYESFRILGILFNKMDRANELINYIKEKKNDLETRSSTASETSKAKKVYVCGLGKWGTTNHLMSAKDYVPFNVANITNICDSVLTISGVSALSKETFESISGDIDIMIIDAAALKNIKPLYQENPTMFDNVKAWQNGEVYLQMPYNAYFTNLETSLINTYFGAKVVYPEIFGDISDMNAATNEITKKFLGKELAEAINACPTSMGGYQKVNKGTIFA